MPCPAIRSGPARKPHRALSAIVTVRRGPGTIAPVNPTISEVRKIISRDKPVTFRRIRNTPGVKNGPVAQNIQTTSYHIPEEQALTKFLGEWETER
jgi:hypothetical protein